VILDVLEQDDAFMLDFETEDGKKQQLPTGTTIGKPTDEGIVEIKVIDPKKRSFVDASAQEATEAAPISPDAGCTTLATTAEIRAGELKTYHPCR